MPEPRLTVALPTCNGARHLAAALTSILDQDRSSGIPFDLLVCDDQSDDATREIVPEIAGNRARLVVNPNRLGLAGNWNQCVAQSRTPLVAIVHQDDVLLPGHLARALAALEGLKQHGSPGMVVAAATAIDDAGQPLPPEVVDPGTPAPEEVLRWTPVAFGRIDGAFSAFFPPGGFVRALVADNPVRCSGVVLSREAHQAVGGFDPSYRYAVDWDFWLRIARRFAVARIISPPGVAFRWHAASETHRFKTTLTDLQEQERLLADVITQDRPSRSLRRQARRRLSRAYLNRAYDAACAGDRRLEGAALRRALRLDPATAVRALADPRLVGRLIRGRRIAPGVPDSR